MNIIVLSIVFGILLGILTIFLIVLGGMYLKIYQKRRYLEESRNDIKRPDPFSIHGEDVIIRVRDAEVEIFENPDQEAAQAESEGAVRINRSEKLEFITKYENLSADSKFLLDQFKSKFFEIPNCGEKLQRNALSFRYRTTQIARATIKRDCVHLSFLLSNPEFGRMLKEEKASGLKIKPVELRLVSEEDLNTALQIAIMTVEYVKKEDEYKREKRKQARKEDRLKKDEAAFSKVPSNEKQF